MSTKYPYRQAYPHTLHQQRHALDEESSALNHDDMTGIVLATGQFDLCDLCNFERSPAGWINGYL